MFIQNKYTKWYFSIIESAKSNTPSGHIEKHHIIPRSLGGDNDKENIAKLTARQHFLCHLLLIRMCSGQSKFKMLHALRLMLSGSRKNIGRIDYKPNSRWFEFSRKHSSDGLKGKICPQHVKDAVSKANKGKPAANKGKPMTAEQKQKISRSNSGKVAWNKGIPRSPEQIENQRQKVTGTILSNETKSKMSDAKKGKPPNNKGRGKHQKALASHLWEWLLNL